MTIFSKSISEITDSKTRDQIPVQKLPLQGTL